jgi:hypothetical protein
MFPLGIEQLYITVPVFWPLSFLLWLFHFVFDPGGIMDTSWWLSVLATPPDYVPLNEPIPEGSQIG